MPAWAQPTSQEDGQKRFDEGLKLHDANNDNEYDITVQATGGFPTASQSVAITVTDVDSANLTGATVTISANYVNGQDVGPASLVLPDLADPAYRGLSLSLLQTMQFQYTGWVRAQKIVPASILKAGTNDVIIIAGAGTSASAIRETQIQLKYLWDKSDYLLEPLK
jgi:hypothetical protein